ncbi:MAG TPA: hypothetical protein VI456_05325, partial [Polyangia bacterium]
LDLVADALRARPDVTRLAIVWSRGVGESKALGKRRAEAVQAALVTRGIARPRLELRAGASVADERGPRRGALEFVIAAVGGRPTPGNAQLSVDGDRAAALSNGERFERAITLDVHNDVPATPADAEALRRAEEACRSCQGLWERHGMAGRLSCYCRTHDGGKSCRSSADCEVRCEIPFDDASVFDGVRCGPKGCRGGRPGVVIPPGRCADYDRTAGCRGTIEPVGHDGEVEVRRLCVD